MRPTAARLREEVGERVGVAGTVAAEHGRDLLVRKPLALVQLLDRRRVPVADLALVDLGQDRPRELEATDAVEVVTDRGRGQRPRDLDAPIAGRGLGAGQRGIGRAEIDRAGGDVLDPRAGADAAVLDVVPERRVTRPLRDQGLDER